MVSNAILIGIIVGVFFVGIGVSYAVFQASNPSNFMGMTPQQMQQLGPMMNDPESRQQMMDMMMRNQQMMQDMMGNQQMMGMMGQGMMNDPQVQQQMMQQMNTMMNDPQLRQQMMTTMMDNQQMMQSMMGNQQMMDMLGQGMMNP